MENNFCIFIISNGRANNVITHKTLNNSGNTYPVYIVIDNEDKQANQYYYVFGRDKVQMFDKNEYARQVDNGDNFENYRSTTHARNACFDIAARLGFEFFLVLDDDYTAFDFRVYMGEAYVKPVKNVNHLFCNLINYYKSINAKSICIAQGGDFIGGLDNGKALYRFSKRKAMNTWLCSINRKFQFTSRLNEDVNTYLKLGNKGDLFLTIPFASITQKATQNTSGGMSAAYIDGGTYVKSFYSVMYCPSFVKAATMNASFKRIHHSINWGAAVPCIIDEKHKK